MVTIDPELKSILLSSGFVLEEEQPHVAGERFLLSPSKVVLVGNSPKGARIIIKASNQKEGIAQIEQEKKARDLIATMPFANDTLLMPREIYFGREHGYAIFVTEFIEQEKISVSYSLEEQFFLALRAFEAQEAFHATTYEHMRRVEQAFKTVSPDDYIENFKSWGVSPAGEGLLRDHRVVLERYSNFLTHTDFVPHNMRVHNRAIYLLDQTAIEFANKYEGWARFLNYMIIHNPELERLLSEHVRKTRGADEYLDLRLMRVYKAGFLLRFYKQSLPKTEGKLKELTQERVLLWTRVLDALIAGQEIPRSIVETYIKKRNDLRSEEEKQRQREFAIA